MLYATANPGKLLRLSIDRAQLHLGWRPRWSFDEMVRYTVEWYRAFYEHRDVAACSLAQIARYTTGQDIPLATIA